MNTINRIAPLVLLFTGACGDVDDHDHDHDHGDEQEVITTVELTFTPQSGGTPVVATWADAAATGNPVIDDLSLIHI